MRERETWRPIAGTDGKYDVSDMGRVRSRARSGDEPRVLRGSTRRGYLVVSLALDGRRVTRTVHRLVIETFRGAPPDGHVCAHLNGNRADPRLANLRWVTPGENNAHMWIHGTMQAGGRCKTAKLSEAQVEEIRRAATEGAQWIALAAQFEVSERAIRRVVTGDYWSGGPEKRPAVPFCRVASTSKFRGVGYHTKDQRWEARIRKDGATQWLGYFDSDDDAARAYDEAARLLYGPDGLYNFPRPGEKAARVAHTTRRQRMVA